MRIIIYLLTIFLIVPLVCFSQKGMTTVGLQIKPIFPVAFLGTGKLTNDAESIHYETMLESGFSGGIIIRHNFSRLIAFETGINYVKRKYSLTITEGNFTGETFFRSINYEIPFVILTYVQVGENIYVNASLGPSIDMFASSIQTKDYYFNHVSFRNRIFLPAISANLGAEYRTEKSGVIYIGASFHRPFSPIYFSKVGYYKNGTEVSAIQNDLSGSYFTIDLRYYFPYNEKRN